MMSSKEKDYNERQHIRTGSGACVEGDVHTAGGDFVGRDKIVYTRSNQEELNDYLDRAVAAFEARLYRIVASPATPPDCPYKFLYSFEIEDEGIFFGRDRAVEGLYQKLLADRLTVLHARSGAGKTSLLNAGLSPRLIRQGQLPVCARAYEDPVMAIKRAIAPPSLGPWPELLPKLPLPEFLGLACQHLSRQPQELVVILDQFEEFFVFWPEREQRQLLVDALADCYEDKALPVRFLVGIRGDYFTHLATCQDRLPHIFHNEYYLGAMTRGEALAAITGPVAKLDQPVAYEQALLDNLLDDLARGGMELPHLQIICTRLYETLAQGESTITLAAYEKLGWAEGVLGSYLKDVLDKLPNRGGAIAKEVLKELVSSEATKRVLRYDTLAARVEAERVNLEDILARLVDARLLRRDEAVGEVTYEMAHEYLIGEIRTWIDQADLAFKQAEELLIREVANWRVHGTLIPRDRLELLYPHRERYKGLDVEACECLLRSALKVGFAIEDWAKVTGGVGENPLLIALDDPSEEIRLAIIRSLGETWGLSELSKLGDSDIDARRTAVRVLEERSDHRLLRPFIAALRDNNGDVREVAARALGKLGDPIALEPLMAALQDEDWRVRQAAVESLGRLNDSRAIEALIATLRDEDTNVHGEAVGALVRLGKHALEQLTVSLRDEDSQIRKLASLALGMIGDPRAVEPLISALWDKDEDVCQMAAKALSEIGGPHALKLLILTLQNEDSYVRLLVTEILERIGNSYATEPLIAALRDKDPDVRRGAARALGKIGNPLAIEPLVFALQDDEDISVRWAAAMAVGEIGDPRAVEPLITALRDKNSYVRWEAHRALEKIGTPKALAALEKQWK